MIKMKKIISTIICLSMLFTLSSCKKNESDVSYNSNDETDIRTTEAETTESESTTENVTLNETVVTKSEYGKNTGTDKTLTGLEPLDLIDFRVEDPANSKGLSTEKIAHAYGVAKNETPNDISVASQKHFDDGNFNALTLDNKTEEKIVYLTFDVGYDNGYTGMILDTLKEKNVKAAFFCTLSYIKQNPGLVSRMINEGHIVGNHSNTHPNFPTISRTRMAEEIYAVEKYLKDNYNYSAPYFRFPSGAHSESALELVTSMGYKSIFWSFAYVDWETANQPDPTVAFEKIKGCFYPGSVPLLHAVSTTNTTLLPQIIDYAHSQGYTFLSLDDYYK